MVWHFEEVFLSGFLKLLHQCLFVYADTHGSQFVTAFGHRIPYQDVAVKTMHHLAVFLDGRADPVVIIGCTHLVRIAVFQDRTNAIYEYRRVVLHDLRFTLFSR